MKINEKKRKKVKESENSYKFTQIISSHGVDILCCEFFELPFGAVDGKSLLKRSFIRKTPPSYGVAAVIRNRNIINYQSGGNRTVIDSTK